MGQAKARRAEIEALKRLSPEDASQRRQSQQDQFRVLNGINPESQDPEPVASLARLLKVLFDDAKSTGNVDPAINLIHSTVNATVRGLADLPVACTKGCSHCCNVWVSVVGPEALFIAKIVKQRGESVIEKVQLAHQSTKDYDFYARDQHPYPCPLLEGDACSIYDSRPKSCRLAASADAEVCARTYHNITNEDVPTPAMYVFGRAAYAVAMAAGLRKAGLPTDAYEMNAAVARALAIENAEQRWLGGEDIFSGVLRQPTDVFDDPQAQSLYEYAFS